MFRDDDPAHNLRLCLYRNYNGGSSDFTGCIEPDVVDSSGMATLAVSAADNGTAFLEIFVFARTSGGVTTSWPSNQRTIRGAYVNYD